jgi:tyrosine-protein kinase Etk/Wzc
MLNMAPEVDSSSVLDKPEQERSVQLEENVDTWGVVLILASNWRRIALVTIGAVACGALISVLMRPTFTATATILPPQQSMSSAASIMGQIGSIAAVGGIGGSLGLKSPADMYIGILGSRTIADHLISRFSLKDLYRTKTLEDTRYALQKHVTFESGKDTLIHLSFKDLDPKRASDIANGYLDELYGMNAQLVSGEAAQRRAFYEQRLAEEKTSLADAEVSLRNTQQKTGIIQFGGQAASIINAIAQAQAEIAGRQVQLQSMQTFATQENPDTIRIEEEIAALRSHLSVLENSQRKIQPGDIQLPAGQVAQAGLEYERQSREVKYHAVLFDLLSRQFEAARLDEAKSAPIIQVIDHAVPPDKKSGPSRRLIAIGTGLFGFCAACLWSLAKAALVRMEQDPKKAHRLTDLRAAIFRS